PSRAATLARRGGGHARQNIQRNARVDARRRPLARRRDQRERPMTARMNWRRARLSGRRTVDHRWDEFGEFRVRDRADRWLAAVERRQRERAQTRFDMT